ncbi:hypothetical protein B0E49_16360 [Polaromonas sp. C04]|nr:hypothetical protein B0E49_16360 [Polaromonas sp. C04]
MVATLTLCGVKEAAAQEAYPSHLIKLVVPYPPGGANDSLARALAQKIAVSLKQPVLVENRAGAGGMVGTSSVAKANPDGYTLLIINTLPHAASGSLYQKPPFDPIADFAPVSLLASTPYVFAVNADSKYTTLQDFIEYAKRHPGTLNYASGGQGGATHLTMELFKSAAHIDITHIPYKGGAPALTDLMAGQVDATFENIVALLPLFKSGKLRPLAISSTKPSKRLPSTPTVSSILKTNFDVLGRFAIVAPAGTPPAIVKRLNTEIVAAVKSPDLINTFSKQGVDPESSTPEELAAILKSEVALWAKVINDKGIRLD